MKFIFKLRVDILCKPLVYTQFMFLICANVCETYLFENGVRKPTAKYTYIVLHFWCTFSSFCTVERIRKKAISFCTIIFFYLLIAILLFYYCEYTAPNNLHVYTVAFCPHLFLNLYSYLFLLCVVFRFFRCSSRIECEYCNYIDKKEKN